MSSNTGTDKTSEVSISRRELISFIGGAAVASGIGWLKFGGTEREDSRELIQFLNDITPPRSVKTYITRKDLRKTDYIQELYDNLQAGFKRYPIVRPIITDLIESDAKNNKITFVKGWALTNTEVALCLLS